MSRHPVEPHWSASAGQRISSSPLLVDLDGDGRREVVVGGQGLHVWRADGTVWPGAPFPAANAVASSPVAADLDGDGRLELLAGCDDDRLYAWRLDGSFLPGFPVRTGGDVYSSPLVVDLDGDGRPEVAAGSDDGGLYVWRGDGSLLAGFPARTAGFVAASPVAYRGALLVGSWDRRLYAVSHQGARPLLRAGHFLWSSPALLVPRQGEAAVFFAAEALYGITLAGQPLAGFPQPLSSYAVSSPALGDVDGDGQPEVVVGADGVHAFRLDGRPLPGFPVAVGGYVWASPALVDVDGDGRPEIVVGGWDGWLHGLRADGSRAFALPTEGPIFSSPAVADLEGDGRLEIVCGSWDRRLHVWRAGPVGGSSPWPQFRGPLRDGILHWPRPLSLGPAGSAPRPPLWSAHPGARPGRRGTLPPGSRQAHPEPLQPGTWQAGPEPPQPGTWRAGPEPPQPGTPQAGREPPQPGTWRARLDPPHPAEDEPAFLHLEGQGRLPERLALYLRTGQRLRRGQGAEHPVPVVLHRGRPTALLPPLPAGETVSLRIASLPDEMPFHWGPLRLRSRRRLGSRLAARLRRSWRWLRQPAPTGPEATRAEAHAPRIQDPQVSIVIPTRDRRASLETSLRAVLAQEGRFEVWVVDDASEDGTPDLLRRRGEGEPRLGWARLDGRRGVAAARNHGFRLARAPLVATLDDDCRPRPGWLRALLEGWRPGLAAVGGPTRLEAAEGWAARYQCQRRWYLDPPGGQPLRYTLSGNSLYERQAVLDVGGFDEAFRDPGGEDAELGVRLRRAGHRLAWAAGAVVDHPPLRRATELLATAFRYGRGAARAARRQPELREGLPRLRSLLRAPLTAVREGWLLALGDALTTLAAWLGASAHRLEGGPAGILRGAGWLGLAQALGRLAGLVLLAATARLLGPVPTGHLLVGLSLLLLTLGLGDAALNPLLTRAVARRTGGAGILQARLLAAAAAVLPFLGWSLIAPELRGPALLLGTVALLEGAASAYGACLRGREQLGRVAAVQVLGRWAGVVLAVLLMAGGRGLAGAAGGLAAGSLVGAGLGRALVGHLPGRGAGEALPAVLRGSLPFLLASGAAAAYMRLDLILLAALAGPAAAAAYGTAFRAWEALLLVPLALGAGAFPALSRLPAPDARRLYHGGRLLLLVAGLVVAMLGLVGAAPVLRLLFGPGLAGQAWPPARLLLAALPLSYLNGLAGQYLYARGRQRPVAGLMLGVLAANLALNAALIPALGAAGAALAMLLSEGLILAGTSLLARGKEGPGAQALPGRAAARRGRRHEDGAAPGARPSEARGASVPGVVRER